MISDELIVLWSERVQTCWRKGFDNRQTSCVSPGAQLVEGVDESAVDVMIADSGTPMEDGTPARELQELSSTSVESIKVVIRH